MIINKIAKAQGQRRFRKESREDFEKRVMDMWNARKKAKYIKEYQE